LIGGCAEESNNIPLKAPEPPERVYYYTPPPPEKEIVIPNSDAMPAPTQSATPNTESKPVLPEYHPVPPPSPAPLIVTEPRVYTTEPNYIWIPPPIILPYRPLYLGPVWHFGGAWGFHSGFRGGFHGGGFHGGGHHGHGHR